MEQKKLSSADIGAAVNQCRKQGFSDEVCALLRGDLTYGLLPGQTDLYLDRSYTIAQQKLLSHALREDYPEEVIGLLAKNGLDYYQMLEVEHAYKKGLSLEQIAEIVSGKPKAHAMKKMFQTAVEKLNEARKEAEQEPPYVQEMLARVADMVESIKENQGIYEEVSRKLDEAAKSSGPDGEAVQFLNQSLEQKDRELSDQQDRLNEANRRIIELKKQVETLLVENAELKGKVEDMETGSKTEAAAPEPEEKEADKRQGREESAVPFQYRAKIGEYEGKPVIVALKPEQKKKSGLGNFFERLAGRKEESMVRRLKGKGLTIEQMKQVRMAIEKGLTEQEVNDIIESGFSAEEMEQAIEIVIADHSY